MFNEDLADLRYAENKSKKDAKLMKFLLIIVGIVFCLPVTACVGGYVVKEIRWSQDVEGHLKRAADSNTVEMAREELRLVVTYLEQNHITDGTTGVVWSTPHEDVGFWYNNIKASLGQLTLAGPQATQTEKEMLLLKLRQTLLDHKEHGEGVTQPSNIMFFPNVGLWLAATWLFGILGVAGFAMVFCGVAISD